MLPECFHRGIANPDGRYPCKHPGLVAPKGVAEADCLKCLTTGIYCNKQPRPHHLVKPKPPETDCQKFSCQHRGKPYGFTPCKLCGNRDTMVLLFECPKVSAGFATIHAGGVRINGIKAGVCIGCDQRIPLDKATEIE